MPRKNSTNAICGKDMAKYIIKTARVDINL